MLSKENRLLKRKEFNYLYKNGIAKHTAHLTMVYIPTKHRPIKIGFTVANKIGKAVVRNLVKRRLRACVREIVPNLPNNYNVVIIAKTGIESLTFDQLKNETLTLFERADLK
ncbi:MAG: ribonuclease P protein component [Clostridiales bacterium]|nr:ribonuclease P protein component [Clostridiales bacterium]